MASAYGINSMTLPTGGETKRVRPRVLILGPRGAGKSSIRKVVFERLDPNLTLFIERSNVNIDINNFVNLSELTTPSSINVNYASYDCLIFVLDSQSNTNSIINKLATIVHSAFSANKNIQFDIFLHKIDGLSQDYRLDTMQNLRERLSEDLWDLEEANANGLDTVGSADKIGWYLTSVFEKSVWEGISKVLGKLLPEQTILERLLDLLCQQCSIEKSFLFDVYSKVYIATDSSPIDNEIYEICWDYLDLVRDFTGLYEAEKTIPTTERSLSISSTTPPTKPIPANLLPPEHKSKRLASSKVKLGNGSTICMWSITNDLSLVALIGPNIIELHSALIDHNIEIFRNAVIQIFDLGLVSSPAV